MTLGTARNGDVRIVYETIGRPGGTPLMLISGNATQMIHTPEEFCAALVAEGFSVVRFDNRDSGRSTHCAGLPAYTLEDMADDALAVLDALGWRSAHLFGVSLGAMIGQVMAVRAPDRVRSLTSMSSAPAWSLRLSRPRLRTIVKAVGIARRVRKGREAAVEASVALFRLIGSPAYPIDEDWVRDVSARAYDIAFDPDGDMRQQAAAKASGDRREQLRAVRAPTLVVHGRDDPMQSVRAGRATADAIPGARLVVYPGVGHLVDLRVIAPKLIPEITALAAEAESTGRRTRQPPS